MPRPRPDRATRRPRSKPHAARSLPIGLFLGVSLGGCASGQTGDPCFGDFDCESGSCSYGSCDSPGFALLTALLLAASEPDEPARPASRARPRLPPAPACEGRSEAVCDQTPGCATRVQCFPEPACFDFSAPPRETAACLSCYDSFATHCDSPCRRVAICQRR